VTQVKHTHNLSKIKPILAPYLETPKDTATKSGQTHVTSVCHTITQIFMPIGTKYLYPGKNTYFPHKELPWELASRPMLYVLVTTICISLPFVLRDQREFVS